MCRIDQRTLAEYNPRSSKRLKAISNLSSVEAYEYKDMNVNAVDGYPTVWKMARVHFGSGIVHELLYARDPFTSELFRVSLSGNLVQ